MDLYLVEGPGSNSNWNSLQEKSEYDQKTPQSHTSE